MSRTDKPANKIGVTVSRGFYVLAFACLVFLFFVAIILPIFLRESRRALAPTTPVVSIIFTVLAFTICVFILFLIKRKTESGENKAYWLIFAFILVIPIQVLIIYFIKYAYAWDPVALLQYAQGNNTEDLQDYFSRYPNNEFIAVLFRVLTPFLHYIGVNAEAGLSILGALLVDIACIFIILTLRDNRATRVVLVAVFIGFSVLAVFSGTIATPYSDTYGMPFIAGAFFFYSRSSLAQASRAKIVYLSGAGVFIAIAFLFKPSNIFILLAIIIVELLALIVRKRHVASALLALGTFCISFAFPAVALNAAANHAFTLPTESGKAFSWHHYLMMGANDIYGSWSGEDVSYSDSFSTREERQAGNLEVAKQRIAQRGIKGNISFYSIKIARTYSDGSFHALYEGGPPEKEQLPYRENASIANALRTIYYPVVHTNQGLRSIQHIVWISVLLFAFGGSVLLRPSRWTNLQKALILTIIGFSLFLTVFETRPRYLFVMLPAYIILAGLNMDALQSSVGKAKDKIFGVRLD